MSEELKPCPFCGGKASINYISGDERVAYASTYIISCLSCYARVSASGDTSKPGYADNSTVKIRAIAKWNSRSNAAKNDKFSSPSDKRKVMLANLSKP